jgi:hypothetical protein
VEQQGELLTEFESKYGELKAQCFDLQMAFFRACEGHEEGYYLSVGQVSVRMPVALARHPMAPCVLVSLACVEHEEGYYLSVGQVSRRRAALARSGGATRGHTARECVPASLCGVRCRVC